MNNTVALERWYRRLLGCFPAEHRLTYGEEMIGVLLASGPQGRRRPRLADVADLVRGGLQARLRSSGGGGPDAGWRDTFAVFSIAAPAGVLAFVLATMAARPADQFQLVALDGRLAIPLMAISLPPLLALRGLRKTAIATAALPALYLAFHAIRAFTVFQATPYGNTDLVWYPIFFAAEAVALAISPGPRRGTAIMTRPAWAVTAGAGGLAGLSTVLPVYQQHTGAVAGANPVTLTLIAVAAAAAIVRMLPAPVGRRLIMLAAIPGYPAVIAICGIGAEDQAGVAASYSLGLIYLPAIALTCLAAALAWWSHIRDSATNYKPGDPPAVPGAG